MTHSSAARCAQLGIVISPQSRPAAWIQRLAEDADELTRVLADCLGVRASNKGKKLHSSCGGALSLALLARILLLVLEIVTAACPRDRHGRLCRCHAACNPPRHDRPSQWKCIAYPVRSIACALQCLDRSASSDRNLFARHYGLHHRAGCREAKLHGSTMEQREPLRGCLWDRVDLWQRAKLVPM